MENDNANKKDTGLIFIGLGSVIVIIGLWLLFFFVLKNQEPIYRGTFGDMFGSVNALFSGLAFAGIILTVLLQRKELSLQRQELRDTRQELKRTANAQEKSEIALNRQAENLKISAKLSALNTLVSYYSDEEKKLLEVQSSHPSLKEFGEKKRNLIKRIANILEQKER